MQALHPYGTPKHLHLCCTIGTPQAIKYLEENMPEDTTVWVGAVDNYLDQHKYIVPGLGDAGDLAFGEKE